MPRPDSAPKPNISIIGAHLFDPAPKDDESLLFVPEGQIGNTQTGRPEKDPECLADHLGTAYDISRYTEEHVRRRPDILITNGGITYALSCVKLGCSALTCVEQVGEFQFKIHTELADKKDSTVNTPCTARRYSSANNS